MKNHCEEKTIELFREFRKTDNIFTICRILSSIGVLQSRCIEYEQILKEDYAEYSTSPRFNALVISDIETRMELNRRNSDVLYHLETYIAFKMFKRYVYKKRQ